MGHDRITFEKYQHAPRANEAEGNIESGSLNDRMGRVYTERTITFSFHISPKDLPTGNRYFEYHGRACPGLTTSPAWRH